MAQQERGLDTPADDLGLIPRGHKAAHNHLLLRLQRIQWSLLVSVGRTPVHMWCMIIRRGKHHTHDTNKHKSIFKKNRTIPKNDTINGFNCSLINNKNK